MTRAMNPWIRMSFESIRPGLASWSTPTVTLDRPPHVPPLPQTSTHPPQPQPSQEKDPISPSTILEDPVLNLTARFKAYWDETQENLVLINQDVEASELTCAQSWPTRRPSFSISSPFKTNLHNFSPSISHRHHHLSDRPIT